MLIHHHLNQNFLMTNQKEIDSRISGRSLYARIYQLSQMRQGAGLSVA
jgi:hypothetical protein